MQRNDPSTLCKPTINVTAALFYLPSNACMCKCSSVQQQQLQNANISEKQRKPQKKLLLNSLALLVWPTVTMRTGYQ